MIQAVLFVPRVLFALGCVGVILTAYPLLCLFRLDVTEQDSASACRRSSTRRSTADETLS